MPKALRFRDVEPILEELTARHPQRSAIRGPLLARLQALAPADYLDVLQRLGPCEIAGDFRFLGLVELASENADRDVPDMALGLAWWLFAVSGTGDAWLVRQTDGGASEIAFLDHDEGPAATAKPMNLGFGQWLQLADLMAQAEGAAEDDGAPEAMSAHIRSLLDTLSGGLASRFPYAV